MRLPRSERCGRQRHRLAGDVVNRISDALQRAVHIISARADVAFALSLMAAVFMLILPLPTVLIDILIAINIGGSALLLMVAMYLPNPLAFSSFPSVLLITTLFRLSLSIATTRLILLQGDAGQIVLAFGNFVVGGNIVVGLVVFLILTVVQFIVITKGAERVAEVAARFSLDGLPGKQMSIDGDMRAGTIDMLEARRRRSAVEKESQLYGAMDGAMKFVKGDAIASIIIVFVNLLGGLMIGTMQRGMSVSDAMALYSILTIGDGLISQIPALLISITAGMIVTRVTSGEGPGSNIGRDISSQILAQPRAILIASCIFLGFALVPGMPAPVFLLLAAIAGVMGLILMNPKGKLAPPETGFGTGAAAGGVYQDDLSREGARPQEGAHSFTVPIIVEVPSSLEAVVSRESLASEMLKVRSALYTELGLLYPAVQMRYRDEGNGDDESYVILVYEVPVAHGRLARNRVLACEPKDGLVALGIPFEEAESFLPRVPTLWVEAESESSLRELGVAYMDHVQILLHHVSIVLRRYAHEFLGVQEARSLMDSLERDFPDLVKELHRQMTTQRIAEILQRLVGEGVSIRNLRMIFETMIEWSQREKDGVMLTEHVRGALKRQISYQLTSGHTVLPAYLFGPTVEDAIRGAVRQTSGGSYLALDPSISKHVLDNIKEALGDLSAVKQFPVLLTSMDIRRYVRKMIEKELFDVSVVSYQELTPDINVHPLARIEMQVSNTNV